MPEATAEAAVNVAHRHGQLAYGHASNLARTLVAIQSGVDVLAHAPDSPDGIDSRLLRRMVERHVAMVPTSKMFATTVTTSLDYLQTIYAEIRKFHSLGGQLLFGTDVGYMTNFHDKFCQQEKDSPGALGGARRTKTSTVSHCAVCLLARFLRYAEPSIHLLPRAAAEPRLRRRLSLCSLPVPKQVGGSPRSFRSFAQT